MSFFKSSYIFVFLIFSVSCWGPSQRSESLVKGLGEHYLQSTFRVAEVNNTSAVPILDKGIWKVPNSLRYKFKVKIISQKDARSVIGHEFYIKTESGKLIKEVTKASGWLEWHEDVSFNFFSNNPSYLVLKREIIGKGLHQGSYAVEMAVNPWAIFRSKYPHFVHLDKKDRLPINLLSFGSEQVRQSKVGLLKTIEPYYPLDMANAKVFISQLTEYKDHINLEVKLEMNLLAKMKDAYGENILYKLKSGRVRAFVSLMATNIGKKSKEHAILFHSSRPLFVQFTAQDRAVIAYKGKLYNQFYRGNLAIAIRLVPEGVSLAPFEALYSLGSYRKLVGTHSLILEENSSEKQLSTSGKQFSYDKFLKQSSNAGELKKKRYLTKLKPYRIKMSKVFHQGVLPGETAIFRTIGFRTKICIEHSWTGAPVINEHFIVSFESKKMNGGPYYTDDEGCLSLVGTVSHKVYKPQKYFLRNFNLYHDPDHDFNQDNFKSAIKKYKRFHQKVSVYLNPWDERIGNFGFDTRDTDKDYVRKIAEQQRIPSKFFIQNFSYNTLGFKYKVDNHLNLEIRKRLQIVLQPYVLRYHSLSYGRDEFHKSLRDGVYLMKVAFQKTYLKPDANGVTISPITNLEEKTNKVQSIIEKIPFNKRNLFQSSIQDLQKKDKPFSKLTITGFSEADMRSVDLERKLLGGKKSQLGSSSAAKGIEYVTAYQKLIKVQNGLIIEPVALKISNPILMKIRGQLLIQLEAVDEKLLQVTRLYDERVSRQAIDFLTKKINLTQGLSELEMVRQLSRNKEASSELKEFVSRKQEKLNDLIRLLKKRSISLQKKSKNHLSSNTLPEDLRKLLKEFSFTKSDIEEVEENSFIKIKGKPILDPNMFVAKDSGLSARTFIAPVTLVRYDNNSYMRPTDALNVNACGKEDCLIKSIESNAALSVSSLINKAESIVKLGHESKLTHEYFEHEKRLAGVSVDDLINRQIHLNKEEEKNSLKESSFALYTRIYGLDYISDYSILEKTDICFKQLNFAEGCNKTLLRNQGKVKTLDLEGFKAILNQPVSKWRKIRYALTHVFETLDLVSSTDIKSIILHGRIDKHFVRSRLCRYMVSRLSRDQLVQFNLTRYVNMSRLDLKKKKKELKTFSLERLIGSYFLCDTVDFANADLKVSSFYKIYKVNADSSSYKEGQSFNVNVGTNFSLKQSFASRFDIPISNPGRMLGLSGGVLPYRLGFTKSTENGFNLASQVMLSVQQSSIAVNLLAYKKCTTIHLLRVTRGVVLCGKLETVQKELIENYYYISQHFTPGDQLDMGALYNHPWLIRMRGYRDMLVFLNALRKDTGSDWRSVIRGLSTLGTSKGSVSNPFTSVANAPLDILTSIKDSYKSFLPSFPSHYQILK